MKGPIPKLRSPFLHHVALTPLNDVTGTEANGDFQHKLVTC